jgi:uncharacterized membrane protein YgdD (TMEM256/DUF423 family)
MKAYKFFIAFAALFGLIAVIMSTISSHGGESDTSWIASFCEPCSNLSVQAIEYINKGVQLTFYNISGLLTVGVLASLHRNYKSSLLKFSGIFFTLGILLFCGSLFATALTGNATFTKLTPFGGGSFLLAWLLLFFFAITRKNLGKGDI